MPPMWLSSILRTYTCVSYSLNRKHNFDRYYKTKLPSTKALVAYGFSTVETRKKHNFTNYYHSSYKALGAYMFSTETYILTKFYYANIPSFLFLELGWEGMSLEISHTRDIHMHLNRSMQIKYGIYCYQHWNI